MTNGISKRVLEKNRDLLKVINPFGILSARMTRYGISLAPDVLCAKALMWRKEMTEHYQKFSELAGVGFNPKSYAQLRPIIYEIFGLDPVYQKQKETSNKYALGKWAYESEDNEETKEFFYHLRRFLLIKQRLSFFIDKFLVLNDCPNKKSRENPEGCSNGKLSEKTFEYHGHELIYADKPVKFTPLCPVCAGTGKLIPSGYDPNWVSVDKAGIWLTHPSHLSIATTLRIISLNVNVGQMSRTDKKWNLSVREIIKAPPGFKIVSYDLSKIERLLAAILYDDLTILAEVRDKQAVSKFASDFFGLPPEQTAKGTNYYNVMKTAVYASQYFCGAETLHETLMKQDVYVPVEECQALLDYINERYYRYRHNVRCYTWIALNRETPYFTTFHGYLYRMQFPNELRKYQTKEFQHDAWERILRDRSDDGREAKRIFENLCRIVASMTIQSPATGVNIQKTGLQIVDQVDKFIRPDFWDESRWYNGDWISARPLFFVHDSTTYLVRDDKVKDVEKIIIDRMCDFSDVSPLTLTKGAQEMEFDVGVEGEISEYWDAESKDVELFLSETRKQFPDFDKIMSKVINCKNGA